MRAVAALESLIRLRLERKVFIFDIYSWRCDSCFLLIGYLRQLGVLPQAILLLYRYVCS